MRTRKEIKLIHEHIDKNDFVFIYFMVKKDIFEEKNLE